MSKIFENIDSGIKSGKEKSRLNDTREQMQIDALKSMNTGKEGYGWDKSIKETLKFTIGFVKKIEKNKFVIFEDQYDYSVENFFFTDPRHSEAPPKGNILLVKMKASKNWRLVFSLGKIRDGQIMACEDSDLTNPYYWDEWKDVFIMQTEWSRRI